MSSHSSKCPEKSSNEEETRLDSLTSAQRSERMGRIKNKDTQPEMIVRRLIHAMGYRYRLHVKELPGRPDLVFPGRNAVIFVHGCFWHRHEGCKLARQPKTRLDFWVPKLEGNRLRDTRTEHALRALGWRVMTIWECQIVKPKALRHRVTRFLEK